MLQQARAMASPTTHLVARKVGVGIARRLGIGGGGWKLRRVGSICVHATSAVVRGGVQHRMWSGVIMGFMCSYLE